MGQGSATQAWVNVATYFSVNGSTGTSLVMVDAAGEEAGLVHLGGGRWYDPALERPLQPNPADCAAGVELVCI